jgi:GR25 family glycosyltransferase involved in LPS biosynthesis
MTNILEDIFGCYGNYNQILMALLIIILFLIILGSTMKSSSENFDQTNKINVDDIIETYVINLKNRPEKKKYMESQLTKHKLKYNIFEAINGAQLNLGQLEKLNIINEEKTKTYMKRRLRRGEYGCALSHILIWARMLQQSSPKTKYFLIFEDDAYLVNNFKKKLTEVLSDVDKKEWDVLYLNSNCYNHFGNLCNGDDYSEKTIQPKRVGYGLYGYIISRNFVEKCVKFLFPIHYAIDVFIDEGSLTRKFTCIRSKEILVHYNKKFSSDTQLIL